MELSDTDIAEYKQQAKVGVEIAKDAIKNLAEDKDYQDTLAKFARGMIKAYMNNGFSLDEAFTLLQCNLASMNKSQ
jgi:rRNA processing protein Krr1/Pno1